jgi:hypothetical protein
LETRIPFCYFPGKDVRDPITDPIATVGALISRYSRSLEARWDVEVSPAAEIMLASGFVAIWIVQVIKPS